MTAREPQKHANARFLLGIDGGGTCCRAQLVSFAGEVLGNGRAGPANPLRDPERTRNSILAATELAFNDAGLGRADFAHAIAGIGLAGVNVPAAYETIADWQHPYHSMHLTTDMQIACYGSHGNSEGAVIISGTGCSGYSSIGGTQRIHSAFGFPFGDKGGAAWIGLAALRASFLAYDKLGPSTVLEEDMNTFFDAAGIGIVEKLASAQPYEYGRLSPLVFAAANNGDEVACSIVRDSAGHISTLARSIWGLRPTRLSLVGGLGQTIEPWLATDVQEMLSPALHTPLDGAVLYAREQVKTQDTATAGLHTTIGSVSAPNE